MSQPQRRTFPIATAMAIALFLAIPLAATARRGCSIVLFLLLGVFPFAAFADAWTALGNMPVARFGAAGVAHPMGFFVFGGNDGSTVRSEGHATVAPLGNIWFTMNSGLPQPKHGGGAAFLNRRIFVVGGFSSLSGTPTSDLLEFDFLKNKWIARASMPTASACGASGVISGKLYLTTACDESSSARKFLHVWDPLTDAWTQLPDSAVAHAYPASGVIGGKLYVAGGKDAANNRIATLEVFDPASNAWSTLAPMPTARDVAAGAAIEGKLVVAGGQTDAGYTNIVEIYDPQTNSWTAGPPMPAAQARMASGTVNNVGYFIGGTAGGGALATAYTLILPGSDVEAPSNPGGFALGSATSSSISFSWTATMDNRGVVGYKVLRDGLEIARLSPSTSIVDGGLLPATAHRYTVEACDAVGNCSLGASVTYATTGEVSLSISPHWSLHGNSFTTPLNVLAVFGSQDSPVPGTTDKVISVWARNATTGKWLFHSPQLTAAASAAWAVERDFEVLTEVAPGAGFWVNASSAFTLSGLTGTPFSHDLSSFANRPSGFNLLAHGRRLSVWQFVSDLGANVNSLWAWDPVHHAWYFYSPRLEAPGAPYTNAQFRLQRGYRDFDGDTPPSPALTLHPGLGFWVEKIAPATDQGTGEPATAPVSQATAPSSDGIASLNVTTETVTTAQFTYDITTGTTTNTATGDTFTTTPTTGGLLVIVDFGTLAQTQAAAAQFALDSATAEMIDLWQLLDIATAQMTSLQAIFPADTSPAISAINFALNQQQSSPSSVDAGQLATAQAQLNAANAANAAISIAQTEGTQALAMIQSRLPIAQASLGEGATTLDTNPVQPNSSIAASCASIRACADLTAQYAAAAAAMQAAQDFTAAQAAYLNAMVAAGQADAFTALVYDSNAVAQQGLNHISDDLLRATLARGSADVAVSASIAAAQAALIGG